MLNRQQMAHGRKALAVPFLVFVGAVIHATQIQQLLKVQLVVVAQGLHNGMIIGGGAFEGKLIHGVDKRGTLAENRAQGCLKFADVCHFKLL